MNKLRFASKLGTGIIKAKFIRPVPLFCRWEITFNCNMNCSFCSLKEYREGWPDVTTKEALAIISQLSDLGTVILNMTGGEPALRKDFDKIVGYAKKKGMYLMISTNGSLIEEKLETFKMIDSIRISIDSNQQQHDEFRKYPGAYKKAVEGIKILLKNNCNVMINSVYTNETSYDSLEGLCRLAKSLGIQIDFTMVCPTLAAKRAPSLDDLKREQKNLMPDKERYLSHMRKLKKSYKETISDPKEYYKMIAEGGLASFCKSMNIAIGIKPDGSVSMPCPDMPAKAIKGDLKKIWFGVDAKEARRLQGKYWFCKNCYYRCVAFPSMLLNTKKLFSLMNSWKSF